MKRPCAVLTLAAALVALAAMWGGVALAQGVDLGPEEHRICMALQDDAGRTQCLEYYEAKEAAMNRALDLIRDGMLIEPGQEELLATVNMEIQAVHLELTELTAQLQDLLKARQWTDDLEAAIRQEGEDALHAAEYWGNMAYVFTMLFQDVYVLDSATQEFHAKEERLLELAGELARDYREAVDVAGGDSRNLQALACDDFSTSCFKAASIQYTLIEMDTQLTIATETIRNNSNTYDSMLQTALQARELLPEEWLLETYVEREFDILLQDRETAQIGFEACRKVMQDQTVLQEAGEPFSHTGFDRIDDEFRYMEDELCAY